MSQRKTLGSLLVRLGMTDREADKAIKDFERKLKRLEKNVMATGRAMSIGFTAPFVLGVAKAIKAYDEETQVVKKLEVALGKTSTALLSQAAAIQKNTVYADDQVITIQAWAAALGHSEGEIQKMTTAAVQLASGLGIGLDQAMEMLHKTTLGVAGGLGKLVPGIKDLTKEQLKSGEAITIVTDKFKGFAEMAAKTGLGPLKVLQNQLGDMMEDIGRIAIPFVTQLAEKIKSLAKWFDDLSPSMKQSLLHFAALVALSGPVLLLSGNVLKLVKGLMAIPDALFLIDKANKAISLTTFGWIGVATAAILGLAEAAEALDRALYKDPSGNRTVKTDPGGKKYTQSFGSEIALGVAGRQYIQDTPNSSLFGQNPGLIPGYGMTFPKNAASSGGGGWEEPIVKGAKQVGQVLTSAADWMYKNAFSTPRAALDPADVLSEMSSRYTGRSKEDGPDGVSMAGFGDGAKGFRVPEGFGGTEMSNAIDRHKEKVEMLQQVYANLGNGIASSVSDMASALMAGGDAFAAFGKAALASGAQVIKAMLGVLLAKATAAAAAGGPIAAVAGLAAAIGVVSSLEGLIGKIKTPKLAAGGMAFGPTMAMVGDNPNSHVDPEVISPLSKLKGMIADTMGGRNNQLIGEFVWRGDDMHLMVKRAQDRAIRRGSGNVMGF